jgi:uncharacterized membrane protein YgdD (TMEM256/DUF423 family)
MNTSKDSQNSLLFLKTGAILLGLCVAIGAFGAHGLKKLVTPAVLETFETGVRYMFFHSIGVFLLGLSQKAYPHLSLKKVYFLFLFGILVFSGNIFIYCLSGIKTFAMIVPIGGVALILAWFLLAKEFFKGE